MKKFFPLLVFLYVIFFDITPVQANSEFSTNYHVTYDIAENGTAQVTQKITLKNLTSQYFVSNFTLSIGSTTLSDVGAVDEGGNMETKVDTSGNKSSINVKFNKQIAGIEKSQTFTLKFLSKDFAQKLGRTWEVNLPKMPSADNIDGYTLVLSVPNSFGDPTSISPYPKSQSQNFDRLFFTFSKDQLSKSGVSVNFGTTQIFDFTLKYQLENKSLFPVITSVTLPPDTEYQDILINRLSPEPLNVTIDDDGNYLAWYKLLRSSHEEVVVAGAAKLYIKPKTSNIPIMTNAKKVEWTKADEYWEKDNPTILATLREIFKEGTPKKTSDKARLIYEYIVNALKYNTERLTTSGDIKRLGAVTVLNNPDSAVCMEFTDLFIALTRAAGVPSRELDGFAYSQNPSLRPLSLSRDFLHAWPEYFDEDKGWIMVDPTWENTSGGVDYFNKFDLNHLVLAIKGISSKTPYVSDDVKVTLSSVDFIGKPQIITNIELPDNLWAGFPVSGNIKVNNQGNSVLLGTNLNISASKSTILGDDKAAFNPIPSYGSGSFQFNLRTPFLWQETIDEIVVYVGDQKITKQVKIKPLFMFIPLPYLFGGFGVMVLLIYGITLTIHYIGAHKPSNTPIALVSEVKSKVNKGKKTV